MSKREVTTEKEKKGWKEPPKVYSVQELKEFGEWLEPYKTRTATMPNGDVVRGYDWKKVYFDLGATNENGAVMVNNYKEKLYSYPDGRQEWHPYSCDVPQEEVENKIKQWKMMEGKNEWIENKKMEELSKMAEEVGIY